MTREDIDRISSDYLNDCESTSEMEEIFALAIKALEQEPCKDCISRETARRIVDSGRTRQQMIDMILDTPSVNPQPKTGHWILVDEESNTWKCTNCIEEGKDDWWQINHGTPQDNKMDYCPHCGAKMESEDKE